MGQKRTTVGYSIWRGGRKRYIGITSDTNRRSSEHRANGNKGEMRVDTGPRTPGSARNWERNALDSYRRGHGGKLPPGNKRG